MLARAALLLLAFSLVVPGCGLGERPGFSRRDSGSIDTRDDQDPDGGDDGGPDDGGTDDGGTEDGGTEDGGTEDGGTEDGGDGGDGGDAGDGGPDGGDGGNDGGVMCLPPLFNCEGRCVDLLVDNRYCGDCKASCTTSQICSGGECVASPCGTCPPGTWCDETSGACQPTCERHEDCPQPGTCNPFYGRCQCAFGTHPCGGACVPDDDPTACGTSCATCSAPWNGAPTCESGKCSFTCAEGQHRCGQYCLTNTSTSSCGTSCSPCPTTANGVATCDGVNCGIKCNSGYAWCGNACVAESASGCGAACGICATAPINASPACIGGSCSFECDAGWMKCGTGCCRVAQLAPAYFHGCVLLAGGRVRCWGSDTDGRLGNGLPSASSYIPVDVTGLASGVSQLASGEGHTCVVQAGKLKCWGSNSYLQLGVTSSNFEPAEVPGIGTTAQFAAGDDHTCAVSSTGALRCWGRGLWGRLGMGNETGGATPQTVIGSGVLAVSAGESHTCAILTGGALQCWGYNGYGQVGDGPSASADRYKNKLSPTGVYGLSSNVYAVSAGGNHTCAIVGGLPGGLKCWGNNLRGQLGVASTAVSNDKSDRPLDVPGLSSGVMAVAAGSSHTCALLSSGAVRCWGYNDYGQVGNGSRSFNGVFCGSSCNSAGTTVIGFESGGAVSIAAANYSSCAVTTEGAAKCWGQNSSGSLGDGGTGDRLEPVFLSGR